MLSVEQKTTFFNLKVNASDQNESLADSLAYVAIKKILSFVSYRLQAVMS